MSETNYKLLQEAGNMLCIISSFMRRMPEIDRADRYTLNALEKALYEAQTVYHKIANNIEHPVKDSTVAVTEEKE